MDAPNAMGVPKTCNVSYCDDRTSPRHPLPSDVELCRKWLQIIGKVHTESVGASCKVVCERHFSIEDLVAGTKGGLQKKVVPTLFLPSQRETNVVDVCRACLSPTNLENMYKLKFEGVDCVQLYETLTSVQVKPIDRISQNLCESCFATVGRFYEFRNSCIESEKILNILVGANEEKIYQPTDKDNNYSTQTNHSEISRDKVATKLPQSFSKDPYGIVIESPQACSNGHDNEVCYNLVPHIGGDDHFTQTNGLSVATSNSNVSTECHGMDVASNSLQSAPDEGSNPIHLDKIISFLIKEIDSNDDYDVKNGMPRRGRPLNADKSPKTKRRPRDTVVKVFSCFCGLNFTKHADFCDHRKKEKHFARCHHTCPLCKKKFRDPSRLKEHMNVHVKEKRNVCDTCGKTFAFRASLGRHVRTAHEGQNRFMCDVCGQEFTTKHSMENHIANHKGQKPYLCHHCGAQFSFYPTFKLHMKNHGALKKKLHVSVQEDLHRPKLLHSQKDSRGHVALLV